MFFTHERAWEEFFCICMQLINKTWKEMRATTEDFNKVCVSVYVCPIKPYSVWNKHTYKDSIILEHLFCLHKENSL